MEIERLLAELRETAFGRFPAEVQREAVRRVLAERSDGRKKSVCRRRSIGRRGDFRFFLRHYFPHYFEFAFGEQQEELVRCVQSIRRTGQREPLKISRALSRGFGKSTIVTLAGVLWLMLTKTWPFPIIISSTRDAAKGFLAKIIEECEDNEALFVDFPELRPARDRKNQFVSWKDDDIVFAGGMRVIAKGFLNAVRGARHRNFRPSALIIDDPDEEKDVNSETLMTRKMRWLDRAALRLGTAWGIDVFLLYTTVSPNCVGEQVFRDGLKYGDWDKRKFHAIEIDGNGEEYSSWEAGAPLVKLLEERERDPIAFAQERQNEPLAETDQKFRGLIQTYQFENCNDWRGWRLALATDLSLGRNERSDFSAIVGVGLSPEGVYHEVYSDIQRRRPDAIERDLLAALRLFPWDVAGIESVANQEFFLLNFRRLVREYNRSVTEGKILFPIQEIESRGDKETRIIAGLQPLVAAGLLLLRGDSGLLFRQLNEFPYGKKDGPDALEMAVRLLASFNTLVTRSTPKRKPSKATGAMVQKRRMNTIMGRFRK